MPNDYGIDTNVLEYLMAKRKPTVMETDRDDPFGQLADPQAAAAFAQSGAQMGTIAGVTPDTSAVQKYADYLTQGRLTDQAWDLDRKQKIASYLQQKQRQDILRNQRLEDLESEREYKKGESALDRKSREDIAAENRKARKELEEYKIENRPAPRSEGQAAIDKKFAEVYTDWKARGGYAAVNKDLNDLNEALKSLYGQDGKPDKWISNPLYSTLPEGAISSIIPKSKRVRDIVREVIEKNLKMILGGQYTERQGRELMDRAYDITQPVEENIRRLQSLIEMLTVRAQQTEEAVDHYEKNKMSLKGLKYVLGPIKGLKLQTPDEKEKEREGKSFDHYDFRKDRKQYLEYDVGDIFEHNGKYGIFLGRTNEGEPYIEEYPVPKIESKEDQMMFKNRDLDYADRRREVLEIEWSGRD